MSVVPHIAAARATLSALQAQCEGGVAAAAAAEIIKSRGDQLRLIAGGYGGARRGRGREGKGSGIVVETMDGDAKAGGVVSARLACPASTTFPCQRQLFLPIGDNYFFWESSLSCLNLS